MNLKTFQLKVGFIYAENQFCQPLTERFIADWTEEESRVPGNNTHLWEESWDDDDQNEEFSKQLKCVALFPFVSGDL